MRVHAHKCVCVRVRVCARTCAWVRVRVCVCACAYVCECIVYLSVCVCAHGYVCVCALVCVRACTRIGIEDVLPLGVLPPQERASLQAVCPLEERLKRLTRPVPVHA
jgi:hypothetical protein